MHWGPGWQLVGGSSDLLAFQVQQAGSANADWRQLDKRLAGLLATT
jgi:hypothetical protein